MKVCDIRLKTLHNNDDTDDNNNNNVGGSIVCILRSLSRVKEYSFL